MKIIIEVSDKVIDEVSEKYNWKKESIVDGIKDWMSYYEDEEFFKEDLVNRIMSLQLFFLINSL